MIRATLAGIAAMTAAPSLAVVQAGLPAGAVVAFTPSTVCEKLPGGWAPFKDAEGRVIVGMAPGMPAASPPPAQPEYWTRGVTLKPEMLPRTPVTGSGQMVVTTPAIPVDAEALTGGKSAFWSAAPTTRLFGYQIAPQRLGGAEALAVGYGTPGSVGQQAPEPVPVTPPFVTLRFCVKT